MRYQGVPAPAEQVIPDKQNIVKIIILFLLLNIIFYLSHTGAVWIDSIEHQTLFVLLGKITWLLLCGSLATVAIQGLGILAHDAVHKVLMNKFWLNELIGGIISALALLPFNANRQFHLTHHRFAHQKTFDPEEPMHNHNLLFALTAGSVIGLNAQYKIFFSNLLRSLKNMSSLLNTMKDMVSLLIAFCFYFIWIPKIGMNIQYTFVPMLLVLPVMFGIRAISDHYGLPAIKHKNDAVNIERTSSLPSVHNQVSGWVILTSPVLEWLWSSVNYHEVHHKFPYLSHQYLKATFEHTRDVLPYAVEHGYLRNLWKHLRRDYYHAK